MEFVLNEKGTSTRAKEINTVRQRILNYNNQVDKLQKKCETINT